MKGFWGWVRGPFWSFLKAHWKLLLTVAATVAAIWLGRKVISVVGNLLYGVVVPKAQSPVPFAVIDSTHLSVHQADGTWGVVDTAPLGVKATDVKAVGQVPGGKVQVEVANPPLGG
jgi:hypothetical protein